ncbi:efflux RND transporter permease subunit [Candidatus Kaiserbacteria bacterium]|nr:efflux RND transporter permease subunit [Candidatus Kaiserbacteria bacterium]
MWEFFIRNNKFAYLFLVVLIGLGVYSLVSIPRESSPEVVIPIGVITTVLPGAPASDIESLITNEIERGLTALENVKKITSTSREGVSSVVVEFEASADIDTSIQDLKDEVDKIKQDLPNDAEDPFVSEVNFVDQPIMAIAFSADLSDFAFAELSKDLEREIESIAGVARVQTQGVRDREVAVIVNQADLLKFGISLTEVTNAIRNANLTLPIGQIVNNGVAYNVAFDGDITDSSQIQNIAVTTLGGQPVYIRDIAVVEDGLAPASSISRLSVENEPSQNSITFNVYKLSGGDITSIAKAVNARIDELKQLNELLENVNSVTILDAGEQIETDLIRLSTSGLQTVFLVVLLLVVAIGWREGILAGTAIPLSFLFGFIGLYFSENTINFLSLFSLILGIGILVDSSIVMVEGINRRMKDNPTIDKREAAIKTIREFSAPLISGTLTTVAMFAGLFIVSGVIGQFIASIPFTLIFLLFASMFVSLAIIPLLASIFLHRKNNTRFEEKQVELAHKLETRYKNWLSTIIGNANKEDKFTAIIAAGLILAIFLTFNVFAGIISSVLIYFTYRWRYRYVRKLNYRNWLNGLASLGLWFATTGFSVLIGFFVATTFLPEYNLVKVVFFDSGDVEYIIVEVENPEGTIKEVTDIDVRRVEEVLYQTNYIESFSVTVGSGSEFGSGGTGEKFANIFVSLKDKRDLTSSEIIEDLRTKMSPITDVKVTVSQPSDGPPTGAAIIVKFLGDDLEEITRLANQSAEIFKSIPDTTNIETSTNNNNTEFVLELDRDKAAALGLNPFMVSQIARTAVFGTDATSLTTLDEDIDVVVKLNIDNNENVTSGNTNVTAIDTLARISLPTAFGTVPLSELVTISLRESSSVINHESSKRVVTVTADVTANGNAREIQTEAINKIKTELNIPDNVEFSTGGGETDESNKAFIEMFLALIVGLALMVGILTLQFNSYRHMLYVLSILPYSLIGIFAGLAIMGSSLSFPSMMGFIALTGIVVNNSILLIDMMNQQRRENPNKDIRNIVIDSAGSRLRPILLTMTTTVIGMIPLTYAGDLWSPLAYAVMYGLVFSVLITLLFIPIIYHRNPGQLSD